MVIGSQPNYICSNSQLKRHHKVFRSFFSYYTSKVQLRPTFRITRLIKIHRDFCKLSYPIKYFAQIQWLLLWEIIEVQQWWCWFFLLLCRFVLELFTRLETLQAGLQLAVLITSNGLLLKTFALVMLFVCRLLLSLHLSLFFALSLFFFSKQLFFLSSSVVVGSCVCFISEL